MGSWTEELPSGKFQARYTLRDGSKRSAGTFVSKERAWKEAAVAEAEANSLGWRDPKAAERTWGEWCAEWWDMRDIEPGTLKRDQSPRDRHLMPKWDKVPLIDITRHDVKTWAVSLRRAGLAPSSVQRHLALFSASLSAAVDAEVLVANPAYRIKLPGGEVDVMRFLTSKEAGTLLAQFAAPWRSHTDLALASILLGTGLRFGEAVGLQAKRVDLDRMVLRVAEVWDTRMGRLKAYPKGRRIRDVPIPDWVGVHLEARLKLGGDRLLPVEYSNWYHRTWTPAIERSGLGDVRPHDCRHTYASTLLQAGVSLAEVGRLLGHVSPATTQRYAHLAELPRQHILSALPRPA